MNVDEACDQLDLHPFEQAQELKETIREAQDLAVNNHGFEFRSDIWRVFACLLPADQVTSFANI